MKEKKFYCKAGHVPMALRMALKSWSNDREAFKSYAPAIFSDDFLANAEAKIASYEQLLKAQDVRKQQKTMTNVSIPGLMKEIQLQLNGLEGYVNMSAATLDIQREDVGLDKVRQALHAKDVAAVGATANSMMVHLKRNEAVLREKGLKPELTASFVANVTQLQELKSLQNELKNKTGRVTSSNIAEGNELWDILTTICDAGAGIYKGKDDVKMKEYTISAILKRISNPQTSSDEAATTPSEPAQ